MMSYRQSLLHSFETCPRRTWHAMQLPEDLNVGYTEASADLGRLVHEVFAEILRTMRRQGMDQIPTEEAVVIMREVYAASPVVLPAAERDDLRWLTLEFCRYRFPPERIMAIERPLEAQIRCPDGRTRTLTGRPDLLMRDGSHGVVIGDYKSGKGKPRSPRSMPPEGEAIKGKQYLSDRGHFQGDCYGLLVMLGRPPLSDVGYPMVQYTVFRELHLRSGEIREAMLGREELEHVEYELGVQMQKLETAIAEGEDSEAWRPRPGRHCLRQCPVTASCPIPAEQRGLGALETEEHANEAAARFVVLDGLRAGLRAQLKARFEESGQPPLVGDGTGLFWRQDPGTSRRSFGVWPLDGNGGEMTWEN